MLGAPVRVLGRFVQHPLHEIGGQAFAHQRYRLPRIASDVEDFDVTSIEGCGRMIE